MPKSKEFVYRDDFIRPQARRHNHFSSLRIERTTGLFLLGVFLFSIAGCDRCLFIVSPKVYASSSYPISRSRNKQGLAYEDNVDGNNESIKTQRQLLLFGRSFVNGKIATEQRITRRRNHNKEIDKFALVSENKSEDSFYPDEDFGIYTARSVNRKIPTPWPINVIQERFNKRRDSSLQTTMENKDIEASNDRGTSQNSSFPSMGALFFAYAKQQARIGFRQISEISAQIWYNLPPSTPPLILLASIPRNAKILEERTVAGATSPDSLRRIIPVFSDPFARTIVLAGLGMAVVSWSNQELQRKRKLTPLALSAMSNEQGVKGGGGVSRVFLPPFLPEDVPEPEIDALLGTTVDKSDLADAHSDENAPNDFEENILSHVSPKIRRHLDGIYETTTTTSKRIFRNYYRDWLQGRAVRKREVAKIRRNRIFDELVALQALKKRQKSSRSKSESVAHVSGDRETPELGYALVTGASRGIGRAIAVELARWEIPLVLVARDSAKLAQLASDLEACYGVKCCVLEADLSKADAAEKIHQVTTEAGISVDILINNAGVASEGLAIDTKTSSVERMVMLNSLTFAKLSVLYGRDMKERRRGRILMMSSMAGLCNASPNTAIYGACKAFGKSLALSMAKEMETYGVGVTCLIPGPVSDTNFRTSSGTRKSLCWYVPFYSRSPDVVAHQGIISLLDGDTQSIPGWQNRAFANIVRPIIPQRLEIMLVQLAFSPLQIPSLRSLLRRDKANINSNKVESPTSDDSTSSDAGSSLISFGPRYATQPPPRFLKLPEDEPKEARLDLEESKHNNLLTEEPSSSSSSMMKDANSTKNEISQTVTELDEKSTSQSDTALDIPNANEQNENTGLVSQEEAKIIEGQEPSIAEAPKQLPDENMYNSNFDNDEKERSGNKLDGVSRKSDEIKNICSPQKEKDDEHDERNERRIHSKRKTENIYEGDKTEKVRRPQWYGFNDDNDDTFSTRLGPITREDRRMILPKRTNGNRQQTNIISV